MITFFVVRKTKFLMLFLLLIVLLALLGHTVYNGLQRKTYNPEHYLDQLTKCTTFNR